MAGGTLLLAMQRYPPMSSCVTCGIVSLLPSYRSSETFDTLKLIVHLMTSVDFYLYPICSTKPKCTKKCRWENNFSPAKLRPTLLVQAALVICGLFICNFAYMRSRNGLFSGTYPLIYSHPWSFYMRMCYMRAYFLSPYLSNITRSTCTHNNISL